MKLKAYITHELKAFLVKPEHYDPVIASMKDCPWDKPADSIDKLAVLEEVKEKVRLRLEKTDPTNPVIGLLK
jgi:hypothetical protein